MANSADESNPEKKETRDTETGKTETGNTGNQNTETGKTGNQNTETGKTETGKAVCDQKKEEETPKKEPTRPLSLVEKYVAGILLIFFLLAPATLLVMLWPDRVPGPKEPVKPLYSVAAFHVRLVPVPDSPCCVETFAVPGHVYETRKLVDLNILMLLLVASAGFLGNMIYVATSLTTFVGADKFNRSWLLWYFVKPFTAAGLALALYFVFRGGLLNYAADAPGFNVYGVITMAMLAGLFTDKATLKLKEIFEVIFTLKKDDRPDALGQPVFKFISATPAKLSRTEKNSIVIKGEGLDKPSFHIKMNGVVVPPGDISKTPTSISFSYTVPAPPPDLTQVLMVVTDDQDKVVFQQTFTL